MSKKKAVTTMTLKDFHGGSIPSELPLPSAPGVSARPPDRPAAAPSSSSAASARPRTPAAATAAAAMPSFLTNPSRIGRHFDEDERTPFEPATPRRPAPSPPSFPSAPAVGPAARSAPGNAWGAKKEAAPPAAPAVPAASAGQIWSATRIAQASAVEKVISGRWHLSKPSSPTTPPVLETQVAPPEMERPRSVGAREFDGVMERPGLVGVRGMENPMERPRLVAVRDMDGAMERPRSVGVRGMDVAVEKGVEQVRPASHEGRVGEVKVGEVPERPKLKLLPRSKPIEPPAPSPTYVEEKQVHPVPVIASVMQAEVVHDVYQNVVPAKTGVAGTDTEIRVTVDRPRLNLKPRSNAVGQSGESAAKERPSVFGGARPREQVLRDRGVDALASDLEKTSPVARSKNEFAKVEQKVEAMPINPSGEKVDSYPSGHRGPRNADRKDYRRDTDRADAYRPTRREDNRKVVEKLPEQQRPEPETWRKPVEPPKPEITAPRFGKAATALELAQAFSKSMSDTVPQSRLTSVPSPRVPPSPGTRDQVGFSRLTDNGALHSGSSHRKINGY
ncbi:translation initiation factor IF-2-like [Lolium rigidum]|uniref:translation initiation factor IF-2-like n=1 Tax=Lolium rigidum TaxID=89674 RepID=UPI001F5CAC3D|nr:translation initiation factor IF-2-like [Lolium rigidum]